MWGCMLQPTTWRLTLVDVLAVGVALRRGAPLADRLARAKDALSGLMVPATPAPGARGHNAAAGRVRGGASAKARSRDAGA